MMKILFVIDSLSGGGAERAISRVANGLVEKTNHSVTICQLLNGDNDFFIDKRVSVVDLSKKKREVNFYLLLIDFFYSIYLFFDKKSFLRSFEFFCRISSSSIKMSKYIENNKPDVIVSFLVNSCISLLYNKKYFGLKTPVVCAMRNKILEEVDRLDYRKFYNKKLSVLFPYLNYYLAVTSEEIDQASRFFGFSAKKCYLIGNGVDADTIKCQSNEVLDKHFEQHVCNKSFFKIVTAGRLVDVKNQKFLIEALALVKEINVFLFIIGKGEEQKTLAKLAGHLGVADRVCFLGWQKNPFKYIKHCDLFVLSSNWEGFPNILLESMVLGLPVASTRSSQAVIDLLDNGDVGFLVDTCAELAETIRKLYEDRRLCKYYGIKAKNKGVSQTLDKVVDHYVAMFDEIDRYENKKTVKF